VQREGTECLVFATQKTAKSSYRKDIKNPSIERKIAEYRKRGKTSKNSQAMKAKWL
jgi:hypothetical protein